MSFMSVLVALLLAASGPTPMELHLDAQDSVAARPERSIGAGVGLRSPLQSGAALDLSCGVGRDLPFATGPSSTPPKLAATAALLLALGPVDASVGATIENGQPRLDTSLNLGVFRLELEGASTLRFVAAFEL
jgi:hypothetical protein